MNVFEQAQEVPTKAKGAGKSTKPKARVFEGVEKLARLKVAMDAVESMYKAQDELVKSQALLDFIAQGVSIKKAPENFDVKEGPHATANLQLKKRSKASGLSDAEQQVAEKFKIPTTVEEGDLGETFVFNAAVATQEVLAKVAKALSKLDLPADLIMKYKPPTKKVVTTDESIDFAFAHLSAAELAVVLPVISTQASRAKTSEPVNEVVAQVALNYFKIEPDAEEK